MKKMKKARKILAVLLVMTMCVLPIATAQAASLIIKTYRDRNFIGQSARERITLQLEADTINCVATFKEEVPEPNNILTLHVDDLNGDYSTSFTFVADGSVTTIARAVPPGVYYAYFYNYADVKVDDAVASFAINGIE